MFGFFFPISRMLYLPRGYGSFRIPTNGENVKPYPRETLTLSLYIMNNSSIDRSIDRSSSSTDIMVIDESSNHDFMISKNQCLTRI